MKKTLSKVSGGASSTVMKIDSTTVKDVYGTKAPLLDITLQDGLQIGGNATFITNDRRDQSVNVSAVVKDKATVKNASFGLL